MKYVITEEQLNLVMQALGEAPAKISFKALYVLNTLDKLPDNVEQEGVNDAD